MPCNHPADAAARCAPEPAPLAAVTGATGFIGRHLVAALAQGGWRVRILARGEPRVMQWRHLQPEVVPGSLQDAPALERLVEGANAVLHAAGLIKATRRRHFFAVNAAATAAFARIAAAVAPAAHFVHVSTLAAREPQLSDYAASKRAGEDAVREILGQRATVLRPPAVYGPGDPETLRFFRIAASPIVPLPGPAQARVALIHVQDLAQLLVALAADEPHGALRAAADARPEGYRWAEILRAAADAVGNPRPRFVQAPGALLRAIALSGDCARLFGASAMLHSQKLREVSHPDWSVAPAELAQPEGWTARFGLIEGFADAVAWYRKTGWLA